MRLARGGPYPNAPAALTPIGQWRWIWPGSTYAGTAGTFLAAGLDQYQYADALQLSVGWFLDNESPPEGLNGYFTFEVYKGRNQTFTQGQLVVGTSSTLTMMSLGQPVASYDGAVPGATLPPLAWADNIQFSILVRPKMVLPFPMAAGSVSVLALAYR